MKRAVPRGMAAFFACALFALSAVAVEKPRVIVSTDIGGGDPDDFQSMVHYLVYADRFDTGGLISSPPQAGRARHIAEVIDAYERDYPNLRTWSSDYPTPDTLRALVRQGATEPQKGTEPTNLSDGARWIINRAKQDDPRPLYVIVWGSATDVAEAVHADPSIKEKLRVYTIGSWNTRNDQNARDYLYKNHPDLWWIESDETFRGMYMGGERGGDLGNRSFPNEHVSGHGALGELFMRKKADIKMGDTPSVLYLLNGDSADPTSESWGGSFQRPDAANRPTYWHDRRDNSLVVNGKRGAGTIAKWREAYLRDWQQRMDRAAAPNPQAAAERFPEFRHAVIDNIGRKLGQTALVDIDNDGDLDYVAGEASHSDSRLWWWENKNDAGWTRHTMGKGHTDVGGAAWDVNGDGWIDFLAGSKLLLNTGQPREEEFTTHDVGTIHAHDTEFADINKDGRMDALANSDKSGLFWYEIPANPTEKWTEHVIATKEEHEIHGGTSPKAVGDIDGDGDGDNDVVTGRAWYENADGEGTQWTAHKNIPFGESHRYGIALHTWVGDLDGDGDVDVVQAEADNPDGRVAWLENDGKGNWTLHTIKPAGERQNSQSIAVADFDNDGDWDAFSGGGPLTGGRRFKSYIWENTAGPGDNPGDSKWREHEILSGKAVHEAQAADIDMDGDVDIVAKPWHSGDEHFLLENLAVD